MGPWERVLPLWEQRVRIPDSNNHPQDRVPPGAGSVRFTFEWRESPRGEFAEKGTRRKKT